MAFDPARIHQLVIDYTTQKAEWEHGGNLNAAHDGKDLIDTIQTLLYAERALLAHGIEREQNRRVYANDRHKTPAKASPTPADTQPTLA